MSEIIAEARTHSEFEQWDRPVQINVGKCAGGEWVGSVPLSCVLEGNLGFLPSDHACHAIERLSRVCRSVDDWIASNHRVAVAGLRSEGYLSDPNEPLFRCLAQAANVVERPIKKIGGWCVSCDARLYALLCGIPTAIVGTGRLELAHGDHEAITLDDLCRGIAFFAAFVSGPADVPLYRPGASQSHFHSSDSSP